jgi:DNA-binding NarL/FixJ family response regulator
MLDPTAKGRAMEVEPVRVLAYARYPTVLLGLCELLRTAGFQPSGWRESAEHDALEDVDVLVADLSGADGEIPEELRPVWAALPSVTLVEGPREVRLEAPDTPARGWLLRDARVGEIAAAVRAVAAGVVALAPSLASDLSAPSLATEGGEAAGVRLTEREGEVLRQMATGLPNKAIARELGISEHTVKFHVGAVLSKLDAQSRTEAVTLAARRGLLAL